MVKNVFSYLFLLTLILSACLLGCVRKEIAVVANNVTLNKNDLTLVVGADETLIATIEPDNAVKNLIWSSSKKEVANVDQNGKVTAIGAGSATVSVTTADGNKTATCNVTVTAPLPPGSFTENFNKSVSDYFNIRQRAGDDRYSLGIASSSEPSTKILLFRIDPDDPVGPGRGPEIYSKEYTHFGTYSARIKTPDARTVQPKAGAVVGYFTYAMDVVTGSSEIDFEWLIADPRIIYIGTYTGPESNLQRIGREINLATGEIIKTIYRKEGTPSQPNKPLTGAQCMPSSITPIGNYNAAAQFYVYGFDWYPDRLTWWIIHPDTNEKIVLWDYSGTTPAGFTGIPAHRTRYLMNFWHTNSWPVVTVPNSTEKPEHRFEVEIDWMSYTPFITP